jgi:molecular chaperone GrpE (heat shock protein)
MNVPELKEEDMQGLEHRQETTLLSAEARRGYLMNGRLLRPALVAVLK